MNQVRALFALVALSASFALAASSSNKTEIKVVVNDGKGRPIDRATVILDFLSSHRQVFKLGRREAKHWEIRTNLRGVAQFPSIPKGTMRLQVIAKDYQTYGAKVDVDEDQKTIDVTLNPPQKQYSVYGTNSDSSPSQPAKQPQQP